MVMPEIGFAEEPIWPQMREDTVAKKNPKNHDQDGAEQVDASCGSSVRRWQAIEPPR